MTHLFLFPTKAEFLPVVKKIQTVNFEGDFIKVCNNNEDTLLFALCGIGKKGIRKTLKKFINIKLDTLISVGCAASLKKYNKPGTVFSPNHSYAGKKESYKLKALLPLPTATLISGGSCYSVNKPANKEKKIEISKYKTDLNFLDMETYWIAEEANRLNIEAMAIRTTVDKIDEEIPVYCKSRFFYFRHPQQLFLRLRFDWRIKRGNKNIIRVIQKNFLTD